MVLLLTLAAILLATVSTVDAHFKVLFHPHDWEEYCRDELGEMVRLLVAKDRESRMAPAQKLREGDGCVTFDKSFGSFSYQWNKDWGWVEQGEDHGPFSECQKLSLQY